MNLKLKRYGLVDFTLCKYLDMQHQYYMSFMDKGSMKLQEQKLVEIFHCRYQYVGLRISAPGRYWPDHPLAL